MRHAFLPKLSGNDMDLVEKMIELHQTLTRAKLPHAFGGALALAWCTHRARGTIDIDINILVPGNEYETVLASLPAGVKVTHHDRLALKKEGQVRLWWEKTPIDLFLNVTPFHEQLGRRIRWEMLGGHRIPFLSCQDLAVFKVFFNRTRDWADLEEMQAAGTLDIAFVRTAIIEYLGTDDERIARLHALRE